MARRSSSPKDKPKERARSGAPADTDRLDWREFNLLENLLVFCVAPSRAVPKESGVCFQIASKVKDEGVCLLFHIDRGAESILGSHAIRPDYLVVYATEDECICTIIEMKGRERKNAEHGIDQMKALRERLRSEIQEHLPRRCKVYFQGILLTPYNAQVPLQELAAESRSGFTIIPVQYDHRAELYPYIRSRLVPSSRYKHEQLSRDLQEFNLIEEILVHGKQKRRFNDAFHAHRGSPRHPKGRTGIYVNYVRPRGAKDEYAALAADNKGAVVAFKHPKNSTELRDTVEAELKRLGLQWRTLTFLDVQP